ncbi:MULTISPECIES: DUF1120 domain-containing protein [Paraburkholderia]|uniref:DUF1120 domain-containing protein n=1 Tax=Paraburkholderia TaxID=1822464 RepID=UPI002252BC84|nr:MULTISPECIES: DUF1120 domain-containing protein [Paraburkholderia]MCX4163082.1 DUF1120 domain-containing protein [Paraburkholderia megapolitana]MDN7158578.1 DUF1120 domain-containing protein [Paraburkholderia sp. CHISQ3]MDQ6495625.1 DUF1120 domain-containing protein [Paraburkholderia megapolitana]
MKQIFSRLAVTTTIAVACMGAHAAETADLKVTGRILPGSCDLTLTNGGVVSYGDIVATDLSADSYKVLPEKQIDFSIACTAPMKVSMQFSDAAQGSRVFTTAPSGTNLFNTASTAVAGLGTNTGKNIGAYGVRVVPDTSMTVDKTAVDVVSRDNGAGAWAKSPAGTLIAAAGTRAVSWAPAGQVAPIAGKLFAGKIGVQAVLNKSGDIGPTTDSFNLDGKGTLTITYL